MTHGSNKPAICFTWFSLVDFNPLDSLLIFPFIFSLLGFGLKNPP